MEFSFTKEIRVPVGDPQVAMINIEKFLIIEVGETAPEFQVTTLEGTAFRLSDQRGKVVLVDFWATWCAPCIGDMPKIKRALETYGRDGRFVVIGISLDDPSSTVKEFVGNGRAPWPHAVLGPSETNPVAKAYNVSAIPATFLIGPDGKVVAKDLTGTRLERELSRLLPAMAHAGE